MASDLGLRPLTARSAVLSLLLGAHPPELPVRELVRTAETFGISDATLRVALTRMVADGDLERANSTYRLSERLLARQRRQDAALGMRTRPWRGHWEMVVVTASGRSAGDRAQLRDLLGELRFGELREGVWLRPDNLRRPLPAMPDGLLAAFDARPAGDPRALARALWDLDAWSSTGYALLRSFRAVRPDAGLRLAAAAAIVRHLLTDPLLPGELLPARWPGGELRSIYAAYQEELIGLIGANALALPFRRT
jgi:phenylacetic acid degradation operon negative regulatory protein